MPTVYSKHSKKFPKNAVYVGRPSKWGNPFSIGGEDPENPGKMMSRDRAVELYEQQLMKPEAAKYLADAKRELRGKHLLCWCAPLRCHADVLMRIVNEGPDEYEPEVVPVPDTSIEDKARRRRRRKV